MCSFCRTIGSALKDDHKDKDKDRDSDSKNIESREVYIEALQQVLSIDSMAIKLTAVDSGYIKA
jgi:hypothetical protein